MGLLSRRLRLRSFTPLPPYSYVDVASRSVYFSYFMKSSLVRDPSCICSLFCNSLFLHNQFYVLIFESGNLALVFTCRRCFAFLAVFFEMNSGYTFSLLD